MIQLSVPIRLFASTSDSVHSRLIAKTTSRSLTFIRLWNIFRLAYEITRYSSHVTRSTALIAPLSLVMFRNQAGDKKPSRSLIR
jgi:hypothetical protein